MGREIELRQRVTPTTTSRPDSVPNFSTRVQWTAVRERSVAVVEARREWDVTVRLRIEDVTDQEAFPEMWLAALAVETGHLTLRMNRPTVPHSTSAIVRVAATSKKDAEHQVQEFALRALHRVARDLVGEQAFGWTLSIDAVPNED